MNKTKSFLMPLCLSVAIMLLTASCRQSLRSQIELKCQEYTRKNCPMKVDNIGMITLDSVVFHDDEHSRYYYYYSVVADSTETKIMQDNRDIMYRSMLSGLINSPELKNSRQTTSAISAIPIGAPGCPEFAFCTASIANTRIAFAIRRSLSGVVIGQSPNKSVKKIKDE